MTSPATILPGLKATIDRVVYHYGGLTMPPGYPHAFVYFITIHNNSSKCVILQGRKWIITEFNGETTVVEGEKIVGQTPRIHPGDSWSYNSYHVTKGNAEVHGSFYGQDCSGSLIRIPVSSFSLEVPSQGS
ncbi:MAG: ApaG domain [Opitutales bacterium]|nr:ApaG domain [Opitutales bacterium]MCH8540799.1 ApaG domain [Opitutales bacterium]